MLNVAGVLGNLSLRDSMVTTLDAVITKLGVFDNRVAATGVKVDSAFKQAGAGVDHFYEKMKADRIATSTASWGQLETRLGSLSQTFGKTGLALTAGVTAPITLAGGAILKLGMDAVESENLVSVSFGDMRTAADEWSKDLSKNLGLNEFELRKQAGTLFNMTTAMGLSRDAAFDMSTGVAKLAADMASFRNIPMEDALAKIRSGLVGEAEPLKQIGILVGENYVKNTQYAQSIIALRGELTESEKVQARWNAILQQTANDQGDLARTMESPSNQLRIMRTQLTENATALGMSLMPLLQDFTGLMAQVVPHVKSAVDWFVKLPDPVKLTAVSILAITAAAGPAMLALSSLTGAGAMAIKIFGATGLGTAFGTMSSSITALGNTVPMLTARLWLMNTAGAAMFGVGGTLVLGAAALAGIVVGVYKVIGAFQDLYKVWQQGGSILEHLGKRDTDNWLRRGLGLSTGPENVPRQTWSRGGNVNLPSMPPPPIITPPTGGGGGGEGPGSPTYASRLADANAKIKELSSTIRADLRRSLLDGNESMEELKKRTGLSEFALKVYQDRVKATADTSRDSFKKMQEAAKEHAEMMKKHWADQSLSLASPLSNLPGFSMEISMPSGGFADQFWADYSKMMADSRNRALADAFSQKLPGEVLAIQMPPLPPSFYQSAFGSASGFGGGLAQAIMGAIQGGGSVINAAGGFIGEGLARGLSAKLTQHLPNFMSGALGSAVNAVLPGLGALLGPITSKVFGMFSGLFDRNKGRDLVEGYVEETFGTFDAMHAKLLELGDAGEELWIRITQGVGRNNPAEARAAIDAINEALLEQAQKQQEVNSKLEETGELANDAAYELKAADPQVIDRLSSALEKMVDELETVGENLSTVIDQFIEMGRTTVNPIRIPYYYEEEATSRRPSAIESPGLTAAGEYVAEGGGKTVVLKVKEREMGRAFVPAIAEEIELQVS